MVSSDTLGADRDRVQSVCHPRKPSRIEPPWTGRPTTADNNRDSGEVPGGLASFTTTAANDINSKPLLCPTKYIDGDNDSDT